MWGKEWKWTLDIATLLGGVAGAWFLFEKFHLLFKQQTYPFITPLYVTLFSTLGFLLFWGLFLLSSAVGVAAQMTITFVPALLYYVMTGMFLQRRFPPQPLTVAVTFVGIGYWVGLFGALILRGLS